MIRFKSVVGSLLRPRSVMICQLSVVGFWSIERLGIKFINGELFWLSGELWELKFELNQIDNIREFYIRNK